MQAQLRPSSPTTSPTRRPLPSAAPIRPSQSPRARILLATGNAIKAQLAAFATVTGTLGLDLTRRAGADADGRAQVNATNPIVPGSSISHWDPVASPNLLMEPAINGDLNHTLDLTLPLLHDLGWLDEEGRP